MDQKGGEGKTKRKKEGKGSSLREGDRDGLPPAPSHGKRPTARVICRLGFLEGEGARVSPFSYYYACIIILFVNS